MQNTRQSHRPMLTGGQYRITMKLKQSMASMPRLDFLAFKPLQGEKYSIENGLLSNLMFGREKKITNIFIVLLVLDMLLLYLYYQAESLADTGSLWLPLSVAIHLINTVIFGLLLLLKHEENTIMRRENKTPLHSFITLGVFLVVHPAPCWQGMMVDLSYDDRNYTNLPYQLSINHLIIIVTVIKSLYMSFTRQLINTRFLNPRGKRLKSLFSIDMSQEMYAVKCIFKQSPVTMFIAFYLAGYFFFSFAFQITESKIPIDSNPFIYFSNCLWFTFITATTVGYGDLRNFSHVGYILNIICMIWGTLITSCILVILTNTLTLNSKEEEALSSLKRVEIDIEYRSLCKLYVRQCLWRLWTSYKYRKEKREPLKEKRMRQRMYLLREQKKLINPTNNITELSQREFDICVGSTDQLRSNNVTLISFIGTHIFSEVLIRQRDDDSSFIDRSQEKQLEDNIQQSSNSSSQGSQKQLIQSVSSLSSVSEDRLPRSRQTAVRPNKEQILNIYDLQSQSSGRSAVVINEEGI